ncbi:calmodulin-like protein 3 [Ruditapes philippinarum]|uniref:calmodulin-like protein 3 n=1 Tax=Ruditapes philippinarum TaxID=129788 RepID=UPI00295B101F|nr:calmodulin-like protein 3 [Ruditapes philippinarum]
MISFPEGDKIERDEIGDFVEQFVHLKSQESINEEIAEAFAKFDTNDGFVITKADFREILTKLGDEPLSNAQADKIIESLETDSENVNVPDLSKLLSG